MLCPPRPQNWLPKPSGYTDVAPNLDHRATLKFPAQEWLVQFDSRLQDYRHSQLLHARVWRSRQGCICLPGRAYRIISSTAIEKAIRLSAIAGSLFGEHPPLAKLSPRTLGVDRTSYFRDSGSICSDHPTSSHVRLKEKIRTVKKILSPFLALTSDQLRYLHIFIVHPISHPSDAHPVMDDFDLHSCVLYVLNAFGHELRSPARSIAIAGI